MKLSLLDWINENENEGLAESAGSLEWPIDLVGEVRRGWPLHPADADALFDAFNALGFLGRTRPADASSRDADVFAAIERFQAANGIRSNGSMSRGGMTILRLNKALDPGRRTRSPPSHARLTAPTIEPDLGRENPAFLDLLRARRARVTRRTASRLPAASLAGSAAWVGQPRALQAQRTPDASAISAAAIPGIGSAIEPVVRALLGRENQAPGEQQSDRTPEGGGAPPPVPPGLPLWLLLLLGPRLLIEAWRSLLDGRGLRPNDGQSGRNGPPPGRGGPPDDPDFCYDRWLREQENCFVDERNRPDGAWRLRGCLARANARYRLCFENDGRPDPEEPREWNPPVDAPQGLPGRSR